MGDGQSAVPLDGRELMFTPRSAALAGALIAFLIGLVSSLLTPVTETATDEPLSTHAAFRPSWVPSVAEPVPDSMRNFVKYKNTQPPVVPSVRVAEAPKQSPQSLRTISKPKAPQRTPVTPVSTAPKSGTASETAIAYAMAQLGKPYVWGATGPNAFDCSGLVQAAFRSAGIQLPRTTKTIISRGTPVSRSAMQRGDLIWTSSGHIGIYLGGNKMIHAPTSGDVVKISTVWAFYAARRL